MLVWREGGCFCGAVRFRVRSSFTKATLCNCSICAMKGFVHLIVPASDFELIKGEEQLSLYAFNTKTAKHYFCSVCGIASYYVPRSHPDGYDVNLRCVDGIELADVAFENFDGADWEANIKQIEGYGEKDR